MTSNLVTPEEIRARLRQIERKERVKILYACESGSRCWGFASPDSDYDVRFIYVRPLDDYLSITERRDVIEDPMDDNWDASGWDLKKTLKLLLHGNSSLFEWLRSPIVYDEAPGFRESFLQLYAASVPPEKLVIGWRAMALRNVNAYLTETPVRTKKYLYALRPLLAAEWLECEKTLPPVAFDDLVAWAAERRPKLAAEMRTLVAQKKAGLKNERGPRLPEADAYLKAQLARPPIVPAPMTGGIDAVNRFFARIVRTADAGFPAPAAR